MTLYRKSNFLEDNVEYTFARAVSKGKVSRQAILLASINIFKGNPSTTISRKLAAILNWGKSGTNPVFCKENR